MRKKKNEPEQYDLIYEFLEEWKDVEGYEGRYQISNCGRVKSTCRKKERLLKPLLTENGYQYVMLQDDKGKHHKKKIHRLVAEAFLANKMYLPEVNHISEIKTYNEVWDLEWCTKKYNLMYGNRNRKIADTLSKPIAQYTLKGTLVRIWKSMMDAQRVKGYNAGGICNCCKGKRKSAYGYVWKYYNPEDDE